MYFLSLVIFSPLPSLFLSFHFHLLVVQVFSIFFFTAVIVITLYNAVSTAVQLIFHTIASKTQILTMFISCLKFVKSSSLPAG